MALGLLSGRLKHNYTMERSDCPHLHLLIISPPLKHHNGEIPSYYVSSDVIQYEVYLIIILQSSQKYLT